MKLGLSSVIMGGIELGMVVAATLLQGWSPRTALVLGTLVIVLALMGPAPGPCVSDAEGGSV